MLWVPTLKMEFFGSGSVATLNMIGSSTESRFEVQQPTYAVTVVHPAPNEALNSDARQLFCLVPSALHAPARVSLGR